MAELTRSISSNDSFDQTEQLVVRLLEGDESAFTEVFHLYKDMVYTLAFKLLTDKTESMDVAQEVFFTLFRKIHNFRGECSLKTWIYRVTINESANRNRWWRRKSRDKTISLSIASDREDQRQLDLPAKENSPARVCYSNEIKAALEGGLKELPFDQRVAVTLRDVEGLSYEEIAEVTGSQTGTIKSRIARGRERLRQILNQYQGGTDI
jgi:RNA polymerase sigma-70 factor (ECF subfamily)